MLNRVETVLRAAPWPRSVVRWLPGNSRRFGPPRRWGLIRNVVPAAGGSVIEVDPARALPPLRAICHGEMTEDGLGNAHSHAPATCVFTLDAARALGPEGFIVTNDDTFLYDASFWHAAYPAAPHRDHPLYRRKKARPVRRLAGTCLSLATDFAAGSFGHFVHDGIARLRLLARAGFEPSKADWIFCPHMCSPTVDALCAGLGVAPDRVLNHSHGHDWEFERLVGASYPAPLGTVPPENASFLRDLGRRWRQEDRPATRVYLGRRGYRRNPENLGEIESVFREFGFLIVDPGTGPSVLAACANAEIVAGIDGSNMTSLAFAPAGARVLIINPPVVPPLPYQSTLAFFGRRQLHLLASDSAPGRNPSYNDDFLLSPDRLRACLEKVCTPV